MLSDATTKGGIDAVECDDRCSRHIWPVDEYLLSEPKHKEVSMTTQLVLWQYLAVLFACHNIGDFAFQSQWMAMEKAKDKEVLCYHVITQLSPFILLSLVPSMHITPQGLVLHAVLHGITDYLKGRGFIKKIWQDQLIHYVCMVFEHAIGWI